MSFKFLNRKIKSFCFSANEVLPIAMPIPVESLNGDPPHRGQDERDGGSPDSAISASPADGGERINRLVEKLEEIANQYERVCIVWALGN